MATPSYAAPEWGVEGDNTFEIYLDVIKSGAVVETLSLPFEASKSFVVIGRMEPLCDLVLQHPSISRVHSVLQFDTHGALFVQDMQSTHGTFVNKKRLRARTFQRLHVGDLIQFGESTRKYAVCGPQELLPEEPDREKLRARMAEKEKKRLKQKEEQERGASWGFGEDAQAEDSDDEEDSSGDEQDKSKHKGDDDLPEYLRGIKEHASSSYVSQIVASQVSEKDQKLFTQLQNKIAKMENLELEKSRICAKQNNLQGLTEGQEMQLQKNTQRIESLLKEIEDLEERIHARNAQRDKSRAVNDANANKAVYKKKKSQELAYDDSDEDDFYDRTKANQQKLQDKKQQKLPKEKEKAALKMGEAKKKEILTAEIIEKKIQLLENELTRVTEEYNRVVVSDRAEKEQVDVHEEVDPLEAFMRSTANELHAKEVARLVVRKAEVEKQLTQQWILLRIAMPALIRKDVVETKEVEAVSPRGSATVEEPPPPVPIAVAVASIQQPPLALAPSPPAAAGAGVAAVSSPAAVCPVPVISVSKEEEERVDNAKRVITDEEPAKPPNKQPTPNKKRRLMGPTLPPPPKTATATASSSSSSSSSASVLEGGDRVWVPPANQTGDGRTKLNDKYGY